MYRKRRIVEDSDSDSGDPCVRISRPVNACNPPSSSPAAATATKHYQGTDISDGEWDAAGVMEAMHGDPHETTETEAVPVCVSGEQIGSSGVEYEVMFSNRSGSKVYREWLPEEDLTPTACKLRDEFHEQQHSRRTRSSKKIRPNYTEPELSSGDGDGDEGADSDGYERDLSDHSNSGSEVQGRRRSNVGSRTRGSPSRHRRRSGSSSGAAPEVPLRRSTRTTTSRRRAVTRQRLDDLMDLRARSQRGIGALHDSSSGEGDNDEEMRPVVSSRRTGRGRGSKMVLGCEEQEHNEEDSDDGMAGFIVDSDEEEEEELEAIRRREKKRMRKDRRSKKSAAKRRRGCDSDGEDDVRPSVRRSGAPSRRVVDDESSSSVQASDDEESSSSYVSSDEIGDDRSLYRRVDILHEEKTESSPLHLRKSMPVPEAMAAYIDMIGRVLLDSSYANAIKGDSGAQKIGSQDIARHTAASRRVENLICTSRESLLGSSAWKGTFLDELLSRPFYAVQESYVRGDATKCEACSRVSGGQTYQVYLYGPAYDSSRLWDSRRWIDHVPEGIIPWQSNSPGSNSSSSMSVSPGGLSSSVAMVSLSDQDVDKRDQRSKSKEAIPWWKRRWPQELMRDPETRWTVTNHCKRRTQLYHTLLHYKIRLILKVKEQLARHGNSLSALQSDEGFVSMEVERFQRLISCAGQKWGGEEQAKFSIWSDDEEENKSTSTEVSSGSRSRSSATGRVPTLHRWLTRQQT